MPNKAEIIKSKIGNPYEVWRAIEKAASQGAQSLTEDELFLCKWFGLYTHRHEKDYFMLRTKQPNGFVTPKQLLLLADITEKQNKGFADITTRQDFQLHWIHMRDVIGIAGRLKDAGITSIGACGDVPRNVVGCPVAGVDKEEWLDAGPVAQEVSDFFLGNPEYANLPRKYKIGISGCKQACVKPEIQCVSLVGAVRTVEGKLEAGFDLHVGGGLSTQAFLAQRLNAFIQPKEALEVLRAITDIWRDAPEFREKRHHARFKYLIHDWGLERFRKVLEERLGRSLSDTAEQHGQEPDAVRDHIGVHAQKQDGLYYIGVPVLVGRITSAQMRRVAELSQRYADGKTIRLTINQNLLLLNVPEGNVEKVLQGLSDTELSINVHPIRRSVVTCTGIEFCKLAITETKARSRQIVEYLEARVHLDEPLRLNITGCPNACAHYQIGHIGLMGSKTKIDGQIVDAYDFLIGGKLGEGARFNHAVLRKVPAMECAKRLEWLLTGYKQKRKARESFNDWCDRVGDDTLVKLLTEGATHPLKREDAPAEGAQ